MRSTQASVVSPVAATRDEIALAHTDDYLTKIETDSFTLARAPLLPIRLVFSSINLSYAIHIGFDLLTGIEGLLAVDIRYIDNSLVN